MHLIYLLTNEVTGKRYVGQTAKSLTARLDGQRRKASNPTCDYPVARSIRKHGLSSFRAEVIEVCASQEQADAAEVHWISFHQTLIPAGYNVQLGGVGKKELNEVSRRKIGAHNRTRIHSEQSRASRRVKAVAEGNPNVKLTWPKVREIRVRYATGEGRQQLADAFGVTFQCVDNIVKEKTWREPCLRSLSATQDAA